MAPGSGAAAGTARPFICDDRAPLQLSVSRHAWHTADMRCAAVLAVAAAGCVTSIHVSKHATLGDAAIAPGFDLAAQDGTRVALASELAHGPVVLVFYRGFW